MNRLRPLMIQQEHSSDQGPVIEQCVGISPGNCFQESFNQIFDDFLLISSCTQSQ